MTPNHDEPLDRAARVLALALIGEPPAPAEAERFAAAVRLRAPVLEGAADRALWGLALRGPGWARLVDAGLARVEPHSNVRLRSGLMLAILEASPHHVRHFLPRPWSPFTPVGLAWRGVAGLVRGALGAVVVRSLGAGRR